MPPSLLPLLLIGQADPAAGPGAVDPAAAATTASVADAAARSGSVVEIVVHADPLVKGVMLLLVAFSVVSWGIILHKALSLSKAQKLSGRFVEFFWHSKHLSDVYQALPQFTGSPVAQVFKAGYGEFEKVSERKSAHVDNPFHLRGTDTVGRALRRAANAEITEMERLTTFLATTSSASPFIGLFGTVWGIMRAFHEIGMTNSTSIGTVGPYISEALIATAVGLFAAIPAGIFYNFFVTRIRVLSAEMENFSHDLLNILERHLAA